MKNIKNLFEKSLSLLLLLELVMSGNEAVDNGETALEREYLDHKSLQHPRSISLDHLCMSVFTKPRHHQLLL